MGRVRIAGYRAALAPMPQHTARLPPGRVQGSSTDQPSGGIRLADLAAMAGVPEPLSARVNRAAQQRQAI
jgi:hypothetical protein